MSVRVLDLLLAQQHPSTFLSSVLASCGIIVMNQYTEWEIRHVTCVLFTVHPSTTFHYHHHPWTRLPAVVGVSCSIPVTPITSLIELVTALQRGDSGMKAVLISPDVRSMASHGLWSPAGCCWLLVSWSVDVHCDGVFNSAYQVGVCAARGHRILSVEFSVWRRTDSLLCTVCGVQCTVACTLYTWAAE